MGKKTKTQAAVRIRRRKSAQKLPQPLSESPARVGRPTKYNAQIAAKICATIATNAKGLRELCSLFDFFPAPSKIYEWLSIYPEFREQYAHAKQDQCTILAEELLEIADNIKPGKAVLRRTLTGSGARQRGTKRVKAGHKEEVTIEERVADMIRHRELQIDTRKFLLAKLLPRQYGDRLELDTGENSLKALTDQMRLEYDRRMKNDHS